MKERKHSFDQEKDSRKKERKHAFSTKKNASFKGLPFFLYNSHPWLILALRFEVNSTEYLVCLDVIVNI